METIGRRKCDQWIPQAVLGLALIGLAACSSGNDSNGAVAPGGSAGASGPIVLINNVGNKTLTSVALNGDSGSKVINTIPASEFGNVALGDMQVSNEDWIFVNLEAADQVAIIDPLRGTTPEHPEHKGNLTTGTGPADLYRDRNDGELIWVMNDGDNAGDDLINCKLQGGGSVTVLQNSHPGPGGSPPVKLGTTCLLADGHKAAAFADNGRVFISSETAGEIAVLNGASPLTGAPALITRIDLCKSGKEAGLPSPTTCNPENPTGATAFTRNNAAPQAIRWSKETKKIYSLQKGYGEILEINPTTLATTKTFDLDVTGTAYTSFGMSPNGKYLVLIGQTTASQATKLGIIDLTATAPAIVDLTTPELVATSPGEFKFSPDSSRFYILSGDVAAATKKDKLFAYTRTTAGAGLVLDEEISLQTTRTGAHRFDVLAEGAGVPAYLVVSNSSDHSISIINTTDYRIKQRIAGLVVPGPVMVFTSGIVQAGNQASN